MAAPERRPLRFGWLSPCIGNQWSDHKPIVVEQAKHILPTVNDHFDSMWVADHFWGFDAKTDPFVEAWTSLTWLAAKFPDVQLCHHVLGHGYRPPALTAKMAATLQVFSENRFMLGIGAGWRGDEYEAYGYDFPKPSVRYAQLEEVVAICRLMWTEDDPSFEGTYFSIAGAAAPPLPEVVPPVCIGANGEQVGLPLAGRIADMWHNMSRKEDTWLRKADAQAQAHAKGVPCGRNHCSVPVCVDARHAEPAPVAVGAPGAGEPTDDAAMARRRQAEKHRAGLPCGFETCVSQVCVEGFAQERARRHRARRPCRSSECANPICASARTPNA